jgi:hypothetical protein
VSTNYSFLACSITFLITITSAAKLKKPANKRISKASTVQLKADEEWDALKTQFLIHIEAALQPCPLNFLDFDIKAHIPRIMPKPGMPLSTEEQYTILLKQIQLSKGNPMVNVAINQNTTEADKENTPDADKAGKGSKRKDPDLLPGNIKRNANIQRLQEH